MNGNYDDELDTRHLIDVTSCFERHDVRCWLDQGTLLGFMRGGTFIPWDGDIDLGVWAADAPPTHPVWRALQDLGFLVLPAADSDLVKLVPRGQSRARPIDVTCYRRVGDRAVRRWSRAREHAVGRAVNSLGRHLRLTGKHVWLHRTGASIPAVDPGTRYRGSRPAQRLQGLVVSVPLLLLPMPMLQMVLRASVPRDWVVEWLEAVTPASYLDAATPRPFGEHRLLVPNPVDDYVAYKFGESWRTPRRDWNFSREDGSVRAAGDE